MKKLIGILMIVSLPTMAISPLEALKKFKGAGYDPTIIEADLAAAASTVFHLQSGYLRHQGSSYFNNYYGQASAGSQYTVWGLGNNDSTYNNTNITIGQVQGDGDEAGRWTAFGALKPENWTLEKTWDSYSTGLVTHVNNWGDGDVFRTDNNVLDTVADDAAGQIRNSAIALKPALRNMAVQTTASALGLGAFSACSDLTSAKCRNIGSQFKLYTGQIVEANASDYNTELENIGDLTDALITLDGLTFGDIFN